MKFAVSKMMQIIGGLCSLNLRTVFALLAVLAEDFFAGFLLSLICSFYFFSQLIVLCFFGHEKIFLQHFTMKRDYFDNYLL